MVPTTVTLPWPPVAIAPGDIPVPARQVIPEMAEPVQVCIVVLSLKLGRSFVKKKKQKTSEFRMGLSLLQN